MANFAPAPVSVLKHIPAGVTTSVSDVLKLPGTYTLMKADEYVLKLPLGNTSWKGAQARLVAVWGGDGPGNRLDVSSLGPGLTVELVSETQVAEHTWAWVVRAAATAASTQLAARTTVADGVIPKGGDFAQPIPVTILPEMATSATLPVWAGGGATETRAAIIAECRRQGVTVNAQIAYIVATARWESHFTPVRESWGGGEDWRRNSLRYYPYYGRGYVQLTNPDNYTNYGRRLGIELAADPDLALQPNVALYVLVHGMMNGSFTGRALPTFVNTGLQDFMNARTVVNGHDRAQEISDLATEELAALSRGP
jgi:hypothetical protein